MTAYSSSNKRIAKNTLILYFRMFLIMIVGLYTSRIVLQTLGVSDFGLYNVVAGLVSMFTFVNSTLASGTQRFLTFALGKNDEELVKQTFSVALTLHFVLAVLIVVLIEAVGLWFLYNKLVIPEGRFDAAFWIFQFSVIICALQITQVPYMSSIIAHERMSVYAYVGIVDVVLKLLIVYLLLIGNVDKLILYGLLLMSVQIINIIIYRIYCIRHFEECKFKFTYDKSIYKGMLNFSGWNVMGCLAVTLNGQGINILLNLFFGTAVNAARAISMQVNGFVTQFVNNFQTAVNPQIVKLYASDEKEEMYNLVENNSKLAAFLMLFIIVPLIFEVDFVLKLWLGNIVPEYTNVFAQIILIQSLITSMCRPLITSIHAIGKMKIPNLVSGTVLLLILPVSYLSLKLGKDPTFVCLICLIPWIFEICFSIYYVHSKIGFGGWIFIKNVVLKVTVIAALSSLLPATVYMNMQEGWLRLLSIGVSSTFSTACLVYFFGINQSIRVLVKSKTKSILKIK